MIEEDGLGGEDSEIDRSICAPKPRFETDPGTSPSQSRAIHASWCPRVGRVKLKLGPRLAISQPSVPRMNVMNLLQLSGLAEIKSSQTKLTKLTSDLSPSEAGALNEVGGRTRRDR